MQMTKWRGTYPLFLWIVFFTCVALSGCTSKKKSDSQSKNIIHTYEIAKIKGLDPIMASGMYSHNQVSFTYEGLLQYHFLKRPYVLEPALAESLPKVSKDGKVYTFTIKQGVLFQDDPCFKATNGKGRELVAEDFIYSFKRLADPKNLSPGWWIFDGKIVGLDAWREKASKDGQADYSAEVEGLKALGRYQLQVRLNQPSYQLPYFFAMGFTKVVAREAVELYGADFIRNPVGTGPYRLVREESNLNSRLVWEKNPTYRRVLYPSEGEPKDRENGLLEDAGKPLPLNDGVIVQILTESQPQWLNFMSGKIDYSGIPKDNYSQAITSSKELADELKEKKIQLYKAVDPDVTHTSFNMKDPVVGKNKYLRQAISLAYNVTPLLDLFYNNRAIAAQGPIPPGLKGYDPDFKNPYRQYNLAKAKELLKKAGYPNGKGLPTLEYMEVASTTGRQFSEYMKKSMADLGIKINVSMQTWPEFQKKVKAHKGQLWGYAWGGDYPDAENFLQLFYSKNVSPGPNDANYSNPEFDRLYEKSLKMPDSPERTRLYKKMVDIVVEDTPWIFGVHRMKYGLTHPWIKNYKPHAFQHGLVKYYHIDLETKKKYQK